MNKKGFEIINLYPIWVIVVLIGLVVGVGLIILDRMSPDAIASGLCQNKYNGIYIGYEICNVSTDYILINMSKEIDNITFAAT